MGITYNTYVGPYVECTVGFVPTTSTRTSCTNPACPAHQYRISGMFCSKCGAAVGQVSFTENTLAVDSDDVREAINERLVTASRVGAWRAEREEGQVVWLPNVDVPGIERELSLEETDFAVMEVAAATVEAELVAFTSVFVTELAALRTAYGAEQVAVR